ncbi:porin [Oxalobacteraceae bacterium A2-2]
MNRLTCASLLPLLLPLMAGAQNAAPSPAGGSPTVYGVLDAGVVSERGCTGDCATTKVSSGVATPSRIGVTGREELGKGAAAVYTVEAGVRADTGAAEDSGKLFGRQVFVGLDSPFGMVTLGRQYNLVYDTLTEVADPFHGGMTGSAANLVGYTTQRYDNTIKYTSPRHKGVIAGLIYSFGELPYNSKVNRAYGLSLGYENGPLRLSVSHQRKDNLIDATGTAPAADLSARNSLVAANMDFGHFTGYVAYGVSKGPGANPWDQSNPYGGVTVNNPIANTRDTLVGVAVPVGATTFLASFIRKDDRTLMRQDANQLAVGVSHALSRRTSVYGSFAKIQNKNGAGYAVGTASERGKGDRALTVGLRHAF